MSQDSLDFGRTFRVADGARKLYRLANDAVDQTGLLTAAGACGCSHADLRRALDRDGRSLKVEWAMSIAAVAPLDVSLAIENAFVSPSGHVVANPFPPMTDRERADTAMAVINSLGPIAQEALRAAMGGRR